MKGFTYGADIEFLLKSIKTGRLIPACGLFGGRKGEPKPADGYPEGFGIQEDGVALELNVPIAGDIPAFRRNIEGVLQLATDLAHTRRLAVYEHDSGDYTHEHFNADYFPSAFTIGCDPDFLAFSSFPDINRDAPSISAFGNWRFAGGHIHVGYDTRLLPAWAMAKGIEHYMTTILAEYRHRGTERDKFYGMPGLYRPKSYGVEYRSLGNSWVIDAMQRELVMVALRNMEHDWVENREHFIELCLNNESNGVRMAV